MMRHDRVTLHHGDCLDVLRTLPDASVDSVVTDPPYGLEFMGKDWDKFGGTIEPSTDTRNRDGNWTTPPFGGGGQRVRYGKSPGLPFQQWCELWAAECLRVLKPGGHLLAFGGTRTWHRLACAVEDAGFEVRDSIAWLYGSGFPKSLDVSKAIDKVNGEAGRLHKFTAWMRSTGITSRELDIVTGTNMGGHYLTAASQPAIPTPALWALIRPLVEDVPEWVDMLVERVEAERKVIGTRTDVATRIYDMGEGSRLPDRIDITAPATPDAERWQGWGTALKPAFEPVVVARKPLVGTVAGNVLAHGTGALNIDGCRIEAGQDYADKCASVVGLDSNRNGDAYGEWTGARTDSTHTAGRWPANVVLDESQADALDQQSGTLTSGGRTWKVGQEDTTAWRRMEGRPTDRTRASDYERKGDTGGASRFFYVAKAPKRERPRTDDGTAHPTVKPLALMRWLVRLVTPPGGVVLEPFAGSGTTVEACILEGFQCVAIEREADYLPLIEARIARQLDAQEQAEPDLFDLLGEATA